MSAQRTLTRVAADLARRDALRNPRIVPPGEIHADAMKMFEGVRDFACKVLGIPPVAMKFFQPHPTDNRLGFVRADEPGVIWLNADRSPTEIAETVAHEAAHAAGHVTEHAARFAGRAILEAYHADQPAPVFPVADGPTKSGFFPLRGGL